MTRTIPILDLTPEIAAQWEELNAAVQQVLKSGAFIMGPDVAAFEREIADYLGVRYAIGVNSGTDALFIALRAAGVQPGDEVLTTPFTFFATAEAISHVGAVPRFVDIDPRTFNIDPQAAAAAVTPKTKAVLPVHLYGQTADLDPLLATARQHGLKVIEDVAQAFGADYRERKAGAIGDAGCFSFFPSKNLGAFGDGGLIATNDAALAEAAKMLRVHGAKKKYYNEVIGYNSRLDTIQAAVLRVRLRRIDEFNRGRIRAAGRYDAALAELPGVVVPYRAGYGTHVFHQYTIRVPAARRDPLQKALEQAGIGTMIYYPVPCHRLPVYAGRGGVRVPHAEAASGEVLSLPIGPSLGDADVDYVCRHIAAALG